MDGSIHLNAVQILSKSDKLYESYDETNNTCTGKLKSYFNKNIYRQTTYKTVK